MVPGVILTAYSAVEEKSIVEVVIPVVVFTTVSSQIPVVPPLPSKTMVPALLKVREKDMEESVPGSEERQHAFPDRGQFV